MGAMGVAVVVVDCGCCVVVDPCCTDFLPRRLNPDADFLTSFDGTLDV